MLSDLQCHSLDKTDCCTQRAYVDDRYGRNMADDMKTAIGLVFELKAGLDKLHPECTRLIEKILMPYR